MIRIASAFYRYCLLPFTVVALTLAASHPLIAQVCVGTGIGFDAGPGTIDKAKNCVGLFCCYPPELSGVQYELGAGCDPTAGACSVRAIVPSRFPGNHNNTLAAGYYDSPIKLLWTDSADGFVGACGNAGARIQVDEGDAWIQATNFSCANPEGTQNADTYTLTATACDGVSYCEEETITTVDLTPPTLSEALCPPGPPPPPQNCGKGDAHCNMCIGPGGGAGGGGGSSAGGGGPGAGPRDAGPGADLVYQAGGAGHPDHPKPADWNTRLGRFWSHQYAQAIVEDPDAGHVWLITPYATFREFTAGDADGSYETAAPSDEYRRLEKTAGGWELRDLDGTVDHIDADGRWIQTVDRNGNAKVATYTGGALTQVTFPDRRTETFSYHPDGKLATITEIGIDGTTSRTWMLTWSPEGDLIRIDRPDGTALAFQYDDPRHPGYMTRLTLIGTDASERIESAWEYDDHGNVVTTWRGTEDSDSPLAVEKWSLAFDDPVLPTETTVTDPLGNVAIYTIERDPMSSKPRLAQISGDCPKCGLGPNTQLLYEDPENPLRVTAEIDGRGVVTRFSYDANGQMTSRIEDFGGALERETTWTYDPIYPAIPTEIARPSTTGNPLDTRRTTFFLDAFGNSEIRTIEGVEAGAAFSYATVTTFNGSGQPAVIDPPGYSTADQTTYGYDPARGDLVATSRLGNGAA